MTAATKAPVTGRHRKARLSTRDRVTVALMILIPTAVAATLVWVPAMATIVMSFFDWDGFSPFSEAKFVGTRWYTEAATIYPAFWPAIQHNVIWLLVLFGIATPIGLLLAVLLDREASHTKFYQTSLYLPVVLSMALIGFIWQLMFSRDQGLLNALLGTTIDWYGDPNINLWSALIATSWRHVGYVMLLYLAGLKGVDVALKEAARIDGASEVQTFFQVVFPVMFPINVVVLVITFIDSLRAFDLVWVINRGRNGLELLATEVTRNIVGEAQRIGFGSALATIMLVISTVFIIIYLRIVMKEDR
ncbi:sugar ABC transporter permease [Propioniciclava sinopodophylli]|uniref:Sugar ABC transporter permease n=1 Tax=Propioniciclava sinopodophylli TaxID=1837344 RepID=A0A4V2JSH1_9ACTN|nr:sugar ABC transporter permease [Propioniciclava sinopodophylli]TBT85045.1 sugar ABC transporter permease [Propioniciclava sinopodophylli]